MSILKTSAVQKNKWTVMINIYLTLTYMPCMWKAYSSLIYRHRWGTVTSLFLALFVGSCFYCKCLKQEFYKKKERRLITRPQYLQETFEQCAEEINRRLLLYQRQSQEYYNSCLHGKGFRRFLLQWKSSLWTYKILCL